MTDPLTTYLASLPGRCQHGAHVATQGCKDCFPIAPASEWQLFKAAVTSSVREDGTIHLCDVRPKVRGRVQPKHLGQMWRRARSEGLVRDTGEREQSDDVAGRNSDKLDRVYALGRAA